MYRNGTGYPFIQSTKKKASSRTHGVTKVNSNAPGLLQKNDALELLKKTCTRTFAFDCTICDYFLFKIYIFYRIIIFLFISLRPSSNRTPAKQEIPLPI